MLTLDDLPLPKYPVVHRLEDKYDYIVAVGDVHGCFEQLDDLLIQLEYSNSRYNAWVPIAYIFLGDLVDRGPNPDKVLDFIIREKDDVIFSVQGNHDNAHIRYKRYEVQGGANPMKSRTAEFHRTHKLLSDEHFKYLASLPAAIQWRNFTFAHAGLDPFLKYNQPLQGFLRNRYFEQKDGKWVPSNTWQDENGVWQHKPDARHWSELHKGPEKVVYGHEVLPEPRVLPFSIGLDTGCVFGNKLTAAIINCKTEAVEFMSVPGLQGPDVTPANERDGC